MELQVSVSPALSIYKCLTLSPPWPHSPGVEDSGEGVNGEQQWEAGPDVRSYGQVPGGLPAPQR